MTRTAAVVHYPEGAGHATRMLAVARALEAEGAEVVLAGGGPGSKFIEFNGYDVYRPATVDYIGDFQDGSLASVVLGSVPKSTKRVADLVEWLRCERPDMLVTDDMFAAIGAGIVSVPLYVLSHNAASLYDHAIEQTFTKLMNRYQLASATEFLYPAVWPPDDGDPPGVTHIPPVALEPTQLAVEPEEVDVLVVPSTYSAGFDDLSDQLEASGREVTLVGSPDWTRVRALLPWVQAANVVVCSGYSTVMEAAVAGTPCVIYPFTDEQHGVSRIIERNGVQGFLVEHSVPHVVRAVEHPPRAPDHENGIHVAADRILDDS